MVDVDFTSAHELIKQISQKLKPKFQNDELCIQYAWWVLEAITKQKKSTLLLELSVHLDNEQQVMLEDWIKKQVEDNIPLQYLIGSVPFADCSILVEPPILIPRQETEEWCVELISKLKKITPPLRILDLCTGSGCIAVSIAKALPQAELYATDISRKALSLAEKNAAYNDVQNITFLSSDLFKDLPQDLTFDIIISNPPYISQQEWNHVESSVKEWEDHNALLAADDGLAILKEVIRDAHSYLHDNDQLKKAGIDQLMVEIGYQQGKTVASLFTQENFYDVTIKKDMQGNDRLVGGRVGNEGNHA